MTPPPEAKRLVQIAAVIGPEVPVPLLQTIAELSEEALQHGLAHLQATEFLYETRLFPNRVYTFKHALTHEVAYGSLLQGDGGCSMPVSWRPSRRSLEIRWPSRSNAWPITPCGESVGQGPDVLPAGGGEGHGPCSPPRSGGIPRAALVAAQHLPAQPASSHRASIRIVLDSTFLTLGDPSRGFDYLREAAVLAEELGDQRQLGRIANGMTHYCLRTGDFEAAIEYGQRALVHATASGALVEQAIAHCVLGTAYFSLGAYRSATDALRRSVAVLEGDLFHTRFGIIMNSVRSRGWLGNTLAELGEFAEGIACGRSGTGCRGGRASLQCDLCPATARHPGPPPG